MLAVEDLADELWVKVAEIHLLSKNERYKSTFYSLARTAAKRHCGLHNLVGYLPVPWPSPELDLFLRRVLEEAEVPPRGSLDSRWTILLSGEINFSHIALEAADRRTLMPDVLGVPAAEKDNPLMWPNLVHELAHDPRISGEIIAAAQRLPIVNQRPGEERLILEEWAHEIIADLLASDIIGPAYLGAFASFAAYMLPISLKTQTASHPSPEMRTRYIYRRLRSQYGPLREALDAQFEEVEERISLDFDDERTRNELFDCFGSRELISGELVEDFVGEIGTLPEYRAIFPTSIPESDIASVYELGERVREGEIIASRRKRSPIVKFESEAHVRDSFEEAIDQLVGTPNQVRMILNAAFARKTFYARSGKRLPPYAVGSPVGYHHDLLDAFREADGPAGRRLDLVAKISNRLDSIISKSIEASEIMRFYQAERG